MKSGNLQGNVFFESSGHLSMAGRMLYAEAVEFQRVEDLPETIYQHVESCKDCSAHILLLTDLMEGEYVDMEEEQEEHPFFDGDLGAYSVSDNPLDIDALLSQIKSAAIEIPLYEKIIQQQLQKAHRGVTQSIRVLSPENEELCFHEVTFTLQNPTPVALGLVVENHKGIVYKAQIAANTSQLHIQFIPIQQFPSGLYYWKLAGKGVKRLMGKFYIYQA